MIYCSLQVKEHEKKTQLGILNLPLNRLLDTSNMALDQRFPLERSGTSSHIKLKVTLRVGLHKFISQKLTLCTDETFAIFGTEIQFSVTNLS